MNIMKGIGMIVIFTFLTACTVHEINQDTSQSKDGITAQQSITSGAKMNAASIPTPSEDLVGTIGTGASNSPHSFTLDFSKVEWEQRLPQATLTNNLGTVVVKTFEASIQNESMSVWKYLDGKMVSRTVIKGGL